MFSAAFRHILSVQPPGAGCCLSSVFEERQPESAGSIHKICWCEWGCMWARVLKGSLWVHLGTSMCYGGPAKTNGKKSSVELLAFSVPHRQQTALLGPCTGAKSRDEKHRYRSWRRMAFCTRYLLGDLGQVFAPPWGCVLTCKPEIITGSLLGTHFT